MPRGTYFSCFAKKSKQKKAPLHLRPATPDSLATDNRGGCDQNSACGLKHWSQKPRPAYPCSACCQGFYLAQRWFKLQRCIAIKAISLNDLNQIHL